MAKTMKEIHEAVFNYLMAEHNKDKGKFFFITRKINRSNKFNEGYWFLGNDNYLAVSFWTGMDTLNRTPRIYFKVKSNGETSIEFRNADVRNHYDFFHPDLIKEIGAIETPNGYSKKLPGQSFIFDLFLFINNEKKIIDSYIGKQAFRTFSISEWAGPLEFINPESFEKQIEVIDRYRNVSLNKFDGVGFLKGFTISNFGPLNNISLDIPSESKWVFLTGENGSGKTSILKAIATGLCQNNDLGERIADKKKYGSFKINILLSDVYNKTIEFITESNKNYKNKNTIVDGFAAYGPIRLITEGNIDSKILRNEEKIHKKSTYGLFNPIGILMDLSAGYVLNAKPKYHELTKDSIIGNLEYILPNIASIGQNENEDLLFFEYGDNNDVINKGLTFDQLPSGTRNFAALILDLLIRLQNQQPEIDDISDYIGVVLIDEIDIHLHPKLQIELVKQLSATFPNIQFIVSTHSPVTLLGAPDNSIFIKVKKSQKEGIEIQRLKKLEKEIKYLTPNTILTSDIFDFDFIEEYSDEDFQKIRLEDYYEDIEKNIEIERRLESMDKSIFPDNLFNDEN
jgi:predicted ATP-binding protein involved in virulence